MTDFCRGTIGVICRSPGKKYERFDWKLEGISSLSAKCGNYYESPPFDFARRSWRLQLYANGTPNRIGWISLFLTLLEPTDESFIIGVKTIEENLEDWCEISNAFTCNKLRWGLPCALRRSELLRRVSELKLPNCLTVTVIMSTDLSRSFEVILTGPNETEDGSVNSVNEASLTKKKDTSDASVQTDTEDDVRSTEANRTKADTSDASFQTDADDDVRSTEAHRAKAGGRESQPVKKGGEKALEDIGKLLVNGENSDITVQVGDVEFKAHKNILAARSPVLSAMFQHEAAEKASNKISIIECEPDVFKEFLYYIYTGSVQDFTEQKAFALYHVADKYFADELKLQCLMYIQDTLCVQTFCNAVNLALTYGETDLLQVTVDFFSKNMRLIISSVQWRKFTQEHSTEANEILIKSIGAP